MIVTWEEIVQLSMLTDSNNYPLDKVDVQEYTRKYTGKVLQTYRTFWGNMRFLVLLDNGEIMSVRCTKCKVVKRYEQVSTKRALEQAARKEKKGKAAL